MASFPPPSRWTRHFRLSIGTLFLGLALSGPARAGGPAFLTSDGQPYRWDNSQPVRYALDAGPLGPRSHEAAVRLVQQAFGVWENVPAARLQFGYAGQLSQDITARNMMSFLNSLRGDSPCPVIFDSDGAITQMLLGRGAEVLGFASPWIAARGRPMLAVSYVVLNGAIDPDQSDAAVLDTAVHELGHLANLDHSQINADQRFDGDPTNDSTAPVMSYFRGPNTDASLSRDDIAWFTWLYPNPDNPGGTGTLRGRVLLPDGATGARGINVIARRIGDPRVTAVSALSGGFFRDNGSGVLDPTHLGDFVIPGLPPGSYTLEVAQLAGSPVVRVPVGYLVGGPKFWHDHSTAQDLADLSTPIVVNADTEVAGVDIVLSGDDLGAPRQVVEKEPNELPAGQSVTLPAVVTGEVEDAAGDEAGPPIQNVEDLPGALEDVYRVIVRESSILTVVLSAAQRGADLDLYVLRPDGNKYAVVAQSTENGTPPETVQLRVPAGRYYIGVHRAADRGTAYTLRMLTSPAPDPDREPVPVFIGYLVAGDVTRTSVTLRWQTTGNSPDVVYYNHPTREIGSTQKGRDHQINLTDLTEGTPGHIDVFANSAAGPDATELLVTPAVAPDPAGAPRIVVGKSAKDLGGGIAEVQVRLSNRGEADARDARIERVTLPAGWELLTRLTTGDLLPDPIQVGGIGAGGAGAFVVRIVHRSGSAAPTVTIKGSYLDGAGNRIAF
jgi:hypothetical protein